MIDSAAPLRFLEGGGACGELVAKLAWSGTSLGPIQQWPAALTATVANLLHTRQPMLLFWGPELIQLYNDAFVPSFGQGKHPTAMGQPARECWTDAWPVVGAQIEAVMSRGEPAWFEDALIPIHRNGRMEEVFWTYSYSPAFDDTARIVGTLVIVTEVTGRVVSARRLQALATLSVALSESSTYDEVFAAIERIALSWPTDLPFLLVGNRLEPQRFETSAGLAPQHVAAVIHTVIAAAPSALPREIALDAGPAGPVWPEPVRRMMVCAVGEADHVLALGISPRLPFDHGYRSYLAQIIEQLSSALRRIDSVAEEARGRATLERIHEERGELLIALQNANQAKDEFLAMLGHELRNPLAPIVTALELMNAKDASAAATHERSVIERQVRHVVRLVDDLLDISKITRGVVVLVNQPIELTDVIAAAVEISGQLVAQRGHALAIDAPRDVRVDGDESRLVQVVANLLTNAARYTPPGGEIRVSLTSDDGQAVLRVADNGSGIAPELLPQIFDLFVQGTRSADRAEGGLGLGLAIVKNLVSLHGGQVSAHSDGPGRGSVFEVRLPLASSVAAQPTEPVRRESESPESRRVLVVDDNEDAAELLGEIVRMRGHDVTVANDPETALAMIDEFRPEVAVLDIGLPGMDGYQLAAEVHAHFPMCHLIALTGYGQDSDRERTRAAGFNAHLVKPVKIDALLEMLARA